jgi:hypothetical protein
VQPARFAIDPAPRTGRRACAARRNPPASLTAPRNRAAARAPRFIARTPSRLPPAGALRADVAPRFARVACRAVSRFRTPHPHARSSVLLGPDAHVHVRVQFPAGPVRNCVLEAFGQFAILIAVEVMPRAERRTGVAVPSRIGISLSIHVH